MRKKLNRLTIFIFSGLLMLLGVNTASHATIPNQGWYGTIYGGYAGIPSNVNKDGFSNAKYDDGFDFGGSFGFKGGKFRYEGEIAYMRAKTKRFDFKGVTSSSAAGETSTTAFMGNIYYDFDSGGSFAPFVGTGIGIARIKSELMGDINRIFRHFKASGTEFAYQFMGGAYYHFTPTLSLNGYYRYFNTSQSSKLGRPFRAHTVNLGVTYRFEDIYV